MRISTKGQVTIPIEIRNELGLLPDTEVMFSIQGNAAILQKKPSHASRRSRGQKLIAQLSGKSSAHMSTDEIMKLTRR